MYQRFVLNHFWHILLFTEIDDCEGHECLNGATCVDGINSYTCTCPTSHSGDRCEQGILICSYGSLATDM